MPQESTWDDDLAEKPEGRYKFGSIEVNLSLDLNIINRQTYSLLDWLGDVGGFIDAIVIIGKIIVFPYSQFRFSSFVLTRFFRFKPKHLDKEEEVVNSERKLDENSEFE